MPPSLAPSDMLDVLRVNVAEAVKEEIERAAKKVEAEAIEELQQRVANIIAALAIRIQSHVTFERLQSELLIHVKLDLKETK